MIKKLSVYISFFTCAMLAAQEKILIITHSFNRPDFIEIQDLTFKKFLQDDYEFVVFNDARDAETEHRINQTCQRLNLRCIRIPQEIHSRPYLYREPWENPQHSCCRCANVVQYSLDTLGFDYPGIVMIIDSDMFLVKNFSVAEYLQGHDLCGLAQDRAHLKYIWNGLVFIDMRTLPNRRTLNFNCGKIEGQHVDVGGYVYKYLKNNPAAKVRFYSHIILDQVPRDTAHLAGLGFDQPAIRFIQQNPHWMEFHVEKHFLHYRAGGNWNGESDRYHQQKTALLHKYISSIIQ